MNFTKMATYLLVAATIGKAVASCPMLLASASAPTVSRGGARRTKGKASAAGKPVNRGRPVSGALVAGHGPRGIRPVSGE